MNLQPRIQPPTGARRLDATQAGFTLVELMISMVLGMFIVLALVTLLINVNRNNSEMTKTNRVIENGRFAVQLLQMDVGHAGFWGGFVPQFDDLTQTAAPADVPSDYAPLGPALVTAVPDPCANWTNLATDPLALGAYKANFVGIPLQVYEVPETVPSPTVPVCAGLVAKPQPRSDVLFVRHLETCAAGEIGCPALVPNEMYFQVAACGASIPAPAYVMEQYDAANENLLFPFRVRGANCAAGAYMDKRRVVSTMYYVRRYASTDGDNIPTLMRRQFSCASGTCGFGAEDALIEGVESLRVDLGIDSVSDTGATLTPASFAVPVAWIDASNLTQPANRGDGIPDAYVHCSAASPCNAFQLMNTVAVKLHVLVRSENRTAGYSDTKTYQLGGAGAFTPAGDDAGYKRHVFSQTLRLTNISARRETP